MPLSQPVDGFRLAYSDSGRPDDAAAVVLLHGWPGDATDYRHVAPLLASDHRVVIPDLRGFSGSDRHLDREPDRYYSPSAQASSVAALITELRLDRPVIGGYDIGSRVAQTLAHDHPELVGSLALSPPLPGSGRRVLDPEVAPETWYQYFHRSPLSTLLLDGQRDKIHAYLHHFWSHWSGPDFTVDTPEFEALVDQYARPGAFEAATNWYRVGPGYLATTAREQPPATRERVAIPTHVLWQELDPIFPRRWADRLAEFFTDITVHPVDGIGHFTPLEAPQDFAGAVRAAVNDRPATA